MLGGVARVSGSVKSGVVGVRLAIAVASAACAALLALVCDVAFRSSWSGVEVGRHVLAAGGLLVATTVPVGAVAATFAVAAAHLPSPFERRPRAAAVALACCAAILAVLFARDAVGSLFTGHSAHRALASSPWIVKALYAAVAAGGAGASVALARALAIAARGGRAALAWAAAFFALACVAHVVDLTVLVALYARVHAALGGVALVAASAAAAVALTFACARNAKARVATAAAAGLALAWTAVFEVSARARTADERALAYTSRDPVLVGKILLRQRAEEQHVDATTSARDKAAGLARRFDVADTGLTREWTPAHPAEPRRRRAPPPPRPHDDLNVVVYFVDTLRADVAADPEVMPSLARFSSGALDFRRAYSTGSDTLHALPSIVAGRYDDAPSDVDLIASARRSGVTPTLFIPDSAAEFLGGTLPSFRFDDTRRVPDYDHKKLGGVWGYGADQSSAGSLVDATLQWLGTEKPPRFFAWIHNYDLHNWRELDPEYVRATAARDAVAEDGRWNWQYRVVARGIDDEFGRLVDGLRDLGLEDRTVVLFVSDHGEALGYHGFWVHSVFLWESLVRVPLVLRVPGVAPRRVDDREVSLVDVAPTLSRVLDPSTSLASAHGEDLLADPPEAARSGSAPRAPRPLLVRAISEGELARIGVIAGDRKLVLSLDGSEPQLVDVNAEDPDETDLADVEPATVLDLADVLVRSPVFPREDQREASR